jgi:hypothetical protein
MGGVRAPQTLSSIHQQELPRAGTSRGAATYSIVPHVGVVNLSQGKQNETGLEPQAYVEQPCKINQ